MHISKKSCTTLYKKMYVIGIYDVPHHTILVVEGLASEVIILVQKSAVERCGQSSGIGPFLSQIANLL